MACGWTGGRHPFNISSRVLHRLVPLSEFVGFSLLATEVWTYALSDSGWTQHSVNHVEGQCLVLLRPWGPRARSGRMFCPGAALLGVLVCLASDLIFVTVAPLMPSTVFRAVLDRY